MVRDLWRLPALDYRVLDVGCGNGGVVRGWLDLGCDAHGCDLQFKKGPEVAPLIAEDRIRQIAPDPYRLPYPDASFDVIVSNQVLEHVRDYDTTLAEMRRVLRPGGVCLHLFPPRWKVVESHVEVPLAGVFQGRAWLALWAILGVRKAAQKGQPWRQVVDRNHEYLVNRTNYLTGRRLSAHFRHHFPAVEHVEWAFLRHTPNSRGRKLYRLGRKLPVMYPLFRVFWSRVVLLRA